LYTIKVATSGAPIIGTKVSRQKDDRMSHWNQELLI
jgi:hypothetical protein